MTRTAPSPPRRVPGLLLAVLLPALLLLAPPSCSGAPGRESALNLPPGFSASLFARVPGARSMTLGAQGTVFVGTRQSSVYAVTDSDGDHRADTVRTIAQGLSMPNGVAFRGGALYVAEVNRILRYDGIEDRLDNPPAPVVVRDDLPTDRHHGWKYIAFGPDGRLYVPVGAPCNVCDRPDDPRYAAILSMNPDGSDLRVFASGIRNTVGLAWHPQTRALWFTNNGRDWLGDDLPPETLNRAPEPGLHFGFPYCHAGTVPDPEYGSRPCADFTPPALAMPAHVAPLGLLFYTGSMFPPEYRNRILMAEHGSWNRSTKVGYRISMATPTADAARDYQPFATGWLDGDTVHGRPVALLQLPDGSILVSDDHTGTITRITYTAP